MTNYHRLFRLALVPALGVISLDAWAGERGASPAPSFDLAVSPVYQPAVDIDNGGEFSLSSLLLRFKLTRALSARTSIGLSLKYDFDDYDFKGRTEFGGNDPWNDVGRYGIGVPIFTRLEKGWMLSVTPSIDWLKEDGADSGESVSYGVAAFALKGLDRTRSVGLGAGVFKGVDGDARVFPFVAVDWRFNERWRLANPFDADALGPAGLELSYKLHDRWRLGGGAVYRSFRFRLDRDGPVPNGIGENKGLMTFLRLRRVTDSGFELDLYVGAVVKGELELQNRDGDELASSDYDTAPLGAVTIRTEF